MTEGKATTTAAIAATANTAHPASRTHLRRDLEAAVEISDASTRLLDDFGHVPPFWVGQARFDIYIRLELLQPVTPGAGGGNDRGKGHDDRCDRRDSEHGASGQQNPSSA